jgi:hypothetical protein
MKDLPATTRKLTNKPASKKLQPQKAKLEPLTTWEGEGGALDPDSGSLTNLGRQNQSELQPNGRR